MAFQAPVSISPQDIYTTSTDGTGLWLGQHGLLQDGRQFVFQLNSSAAIQPAGQLAATIAATANHLNRTLTVAAPVGATKITIPLGATAATANQYQYGYIVVVDGTGKGQQFVVKSNPAVTLSTSGIFTLDNKTPVIVALDTTSVVSLYPNPWLNTATSTATTSQSITGVPVISVPVSTYFWGQVTGYCSVLSDGAITKGGEAGPSGSVAGAATALGTTNIKSTVGYAPELTVDTKYQPLVLQII